MQSAALDQIHRLLGIARAAEEANLKNFAEQIEVSRSRAARMMEDARRMPTPGPGQRSGATDLAVAARWRMRLLDQAREEIRQAHRLEAEAVAARLRLTMAFGREQAAATLVERAAIEERRLAERRAVAASLACRGWQVQPDSS